MLTVTVKLPFSNPMHNDLLYNQDLLSITENGKGLIPWVIVRTWNKKEDEERGWVGKASAFFHSLFFMVIETRVLYKKRRAYPTYSFYYCVMYILIRQRKWKWIKNSGEAVSQTFIICSISRIMQKKSSTGKNFFVVVELYWDNVCDVRGKALYKTYTHLTFSM